VASKFRIAIHRPSISPWLLFTRLLLWVSMIHFPQWVHGAEPGLLMSSIAFAVSHVIVPVAAVRANPTTSGVGCWSLRFGVPPKGE
jgi:hypothetical protein